MSIKVVEIKYFGVENNKYGELKYVNWLRKKKFSRIFDVFCKKILFSGKITMCSTGNDLI